MKLNFLITSLLITLLNYLAYCSNSELLSGHWIGTMETGGKVIDISIDLSTEDKVFSSYDLMLLKQPISNLTIENGIIGFSVILDVEIIYYGKISDNEISGTATINGGPPNMNIEFSLIKQAEKPIKPYSIESLTIKNDGISLSAHIYKPSTDGLHPAIVLLHGSSTNLKSNYAFDADYFARLGFEVLIFDKRGNGESTGNYYLSNYDDLIADAIVCLETMYRRESVDKDRIGLWGFSQGAMLLPKIVSKTSIPKFLIAKSPEICSVSEAAAFSDSLRIVSSGNSEINGQIAAESHRSVEKMIREAKSHEEVEAYIHQNALDNNFMNETGLREDISIDIDEFKGFYWQGRKEHFTPFWESISIPALVLFGGRDSFVNAKKNASILKNLNNENIETKFFPMANHNLKKTFNPGIDTEFDWPRLIEGYSDHLEKWIKNEIIKQQNTNK